MRMTDVHLIGSDGTPFPVSVAADRDRVFIECREPALFLRRMRPDRFPSTLPSDHYLRGVVIDRAEAHFQLRDAFGAVADDILRLSPVEVEALLSELLCR